MSALKFVAHIFKIAVRNGNAKLIVIINKLCIPKIKLSQDKLSLKDTISVFANKIVTIHQCFKLSPTLKQGSNKYDSVLE